MKYACLVYLKEAEINALSQGEWDALNNECMTFGETGVGSVEHLGGEVGAIRGHLHPGDAHIERGSGRKAACL